MPDGAVQPVQGVQARTASYNKRVSGFDRLAAAFG